MQVRRDDLVFTSRENPLSDHQGRRNPLLKVAWGCRLNTERFNADIAPWEAWRLIAEARIAAAHKRMSKHGIPVFTGESGLVIRGLPTWWDNPDVTVRRPGRSSTPLAIQKVEWKNFNVPAVEVVQVVAAPSYDLLAVEKMGDFYVASPGLTLVDLCRRGHALQAFYGDRKSVV